MEKKYNQIEKGELLYYIWQLEKANTALRAQCDYYYYELANTAAELSNLKAELPGQYARGDWSD